MTDRTSEFDTMFATASKGNSNAGRGQVNSKPRSNANSVQSETAEFSAAASDISKEVHLVSSRLEQLTKRKVLNYLILIIYIYI